MSMSEMLLWAAELHGDGVIIDTAHVCALLLMEILKSTSHPFFDPLPKWFGDSRVQAGNSYPIPPHTRRTVLYITAARLFIPNT